MNISYTVCSANYLHYAKALGDSIIAYNSNIKFVIFLLDKYEIKNSSIFEKFDVIGVDDIWLPELEDMNKRYNIFELSCALKPFAAQYIISNYTNCEKLLYFDCDILVFNTLQNVLQKLDHFSILLTPHKVTYSNSLDKNVFETQFLGAGIFNAGFFAIKNNPSVIEFLDWWKIRLIHHCYCKPHIGLFVDQLWLNLVPIFFKDYAPFTDLGYNVAYWNIAERGISKKNDVFYINENIPLTFFHFSGYAESTPHLLSKYAPDITFEKYPATYDLFQFYVNKSNINYGEDFKNVKPYFGIIAPKTAVREQNFFKRKYKKWFKKN